MYLARTAVTTRRGEGCLHIHKRGAEIGLAVTVAQPVLTPHLGLLGLVEFLTELEAYKDKGRQLQTLGPSINIL